ncbi:fungal-specific transcription factor domain-containing protein [Rhodocollybia butyracea]|uniref:Fungal-specific transcription factor domain-containing protein n=1 Tax=Rhodocollybia butyracea TaxID=206335 RepID=A0A9P5UAS9_9AGAR|nr:fungal-specific transcription factor domain-containing protein [Rhodocollybia butyracea]
MSRNLDSAYGQQHHAASYHSHVLSSHTNQNATSAPLPPLQLVPAPPPDRPKRKRLAKACDACHKSKRRCDGTAPCSNCYFASKPCSYTDSSGRPVPAPRVSTVGPAGSNGQHVKAVQPIASQDTHPHPGPKSLRAQQNSYGHAGPPYFLPAPSLPQQQPSSASSSQHPYPHPIQFSNFNPYPSPHIQSRHDWETSSVFPQNQARKRPRQDTSDDPQDLRSSLDAIQDRDVESGRDGDVISAPPRTNTMGHTLVGGYAARPTIELDPALTRELTNLFFTHSHPMVMIIHKPSFTNAVTMNQVPMYLLYTVCALASRHSKQPSLATFPRRFSGRHFADEAVRLMFVPSKRSVTVTTRGGDESGMDDAGLVKSAHGKGKDNNGDEEAQGTPSIDALYKGELVLPASLYTVQALCLLTYYELLTSRFRTDSAEPKSAVLSPGGERCRELALQMIQELGVHKPQFPLLTPIPSQGFIEQSIEKECIRRGFWLIYILDSLRAIYYQGDSSLLGHSGQGFPNSRAKSSSGSQVAISSRNVLENMPQGNSHSLTDSIPLSDPYDPSKVSIPFPAYFSTPHNPSASFSPPIPAFTNGILGFTEDELRVRLPVDEASFEMGVVHECLPEYLYLPSPPAPSAELPFYKSSASGSELAQMIRILTIYNKIERTLDALCQPSSFTANAHPSSSTTPSFRHYEDRNALSSAITDVYELFTIWDESFPPHLRWDEGENVALQKSMLETNSNTGAWCFCLIAILEASCIMGLGMGRRVLQGESWEIRTVPLTKEGEARGSRASDSYQMKDMDDGGQGMTIGLRPDWWKAGNRKEKPNETDLEWGLRRLDSVLEMMGERVGSSAAMGAWLWPLIKYIRRDDEKVQKGLDIFEEFCGVRMDKLTGYRWGVMRNVDAEMSDVWADPPQPQLQQDEAETPLTEMSEGINCL